MVQLKILSGKKAGTEWSARHFPFSVGRASSNDVQLEEAGVWEKHFEISPQLPNGFLLRAKNESPVTISGQSETEVILKNGDIIEAGAARLQFRLAPARQSSLVKNEIAIWTALGLVCAGQIALLYWLLQ